MRNFLILSLLLVAQTCLAELCPSVTDIKKNHIKEWVAYDSEEGTPLSADQFAKFQQSLEQFALAEWTDTENNRGVVHCYYRDKQGSSLEAFLAKANFLPDNSHNGWYSVSGSLHCAAGMEHCLFKSNRLAQNQLAKK